MNTQSFPLPSLSRRDSLKLIALTAATTALSPTTALANLLNSSTILDWSEIKPGFHALANLDTGGNTLIHTTQSTITIIDTKYPHLAGALLKDAKAISAADHPDLILINTHHHADHTAGNALILPHAKNSYAHQNAIPRIQSQIHRFKSNAKTAPAQAELFSNSKELKSLAEQATKDASKWTKKHITPANPVDGNANKIKIGDTLGGVTLHHFGPGHTDNDLVVHFENENVIHTGDLVFAGLHPFFDPTAGLNTIGWLLALNQTYKLCDKDTKVIPGHGQPADRTIIQKQIEYHTQLIAQVKKQIDAGTSKADTAKMNWPFMDGLGFESIRERAINATYDELSK